MTFKSEKRVLIEAPLEVTVLSKLMKERRPSHDTSVNYLIVCASVWENNSLALIVE